MVLYVSKVGPVHKLISMKSHQNLERFLTSNLQELVL